MAEFSDREHFIPIRCQDLIELLCGDRGPGASQPLTASEKANFCSFAQQIREYFHKEYYQRLLELKHAYSAFDPDSDTVTIHNLTAEQRQSEQDRLFHDFTSLLERANYTRMTREQIEKEMEGSSYWGIDMSVEWRVFDRIEIFYRGSKIGHRVKRHWLKIWQKLDISLPIWQRLTIIIRLKPHRRLGKHADTDHIFLKLFKDIPRMDLEMLLPGTRIKMKLLERGKLGASLLSSIGYVAWKLSDYSLKILEQGLFALYAPVALVLGYAYKTWSGFTTTRQTYMLQLTQSLYYQNLDNNAGVIYRLLDEAEDQETREVLLAYFYLWRYAKERAWTLAELDDYIELDLEKRLSLNIDFEIKDAVEKLKRLHLLLPDDQGMHVIPIEEAIVSLRKQQTMLHGG